MSRCGPNSLFLSQQWLRNFESVLDEKLRDWAQGTVLQRHDADRSRRYRNLDR
jgi:hypothetical protein